MVIESQLILLDTRNSSYPDTPSDTRFSLDFVAANYIQDYVLSIESVSFPNVVYPINSTNNKVYFKEDGGATIECTLTEGNYTGPEMATELGTQLDACSVLGRTYAVTFDTQTKKITITLTLPDTIQFVTGDNNAYNELGYSVPTAASTVLTSDYPVRLDGTQYVDIISSIGNMNYSSDGRTNVLARVPVMSSFGSLIFYENDSDDYLDLAENDIVNVEFRLLDDRGLTWDLPPNANVSYVFKIARINQ